IAWNKDGFCHGLVHFDLEANEQTWCPLVVPRDYRVLQLLVDGVPTTAHADDRRDGQGESKQERRFRILLGSRGLPRRVSIVFAGRLADNFGASGTFLSPRLGDLAVARSIWTLEGPDGVEIVDPLQARPWRIDLIRGRCLLQAIEGAARSDADASDLLAWIRVHQDRFLCLRSVLEEDRNGDEGSAVTQPIADLLDSLGRQWTALGRRAGDHAPLKPDAGASRAKSSSANRRPFDEFERLVAIARTDDGGLQPLVVSFDRGISAWVAERWPAVVLLGSLLALGCLGAARGWWQTLMRRRPRAWILVAGLAWWWLLTPSFLGLVIAAVGLWLTIRGPRQPRRAGDSRVVITP
ncbi:MAG TPA: hypothetical protein VJL29_15935, partial [Thermoguttaceae bacterium]|nr:hypothetical protein [Thermoguttaceae bacterium]